MTVPSTTAVPSSLPQDLLFNAEKIDEAVNTGALTYIDRFGLARKTLAGATASISAVNPRGAWVTATLYQPRDVVSNSGTWYIALDTHTSGATFAGDQTAHWRVFQGVLSSDLASSASAILGAGMVGFSTSQAYGAGTTGEALRSLFIATGVAKPLRCDVGGGADAYALARFKANFAVAQHGEYGFLDNSTINYPGGLTPPVGHASFNDNVTVSGSNGFDHHHSYQSDPHYSAAATLNVLSSFWSLIDATAGTITEGSGLKVNNPTGAGTITALYGVKIEALTRGTSNWGVFVTGPTASFFGGSVGYGSVVTQYAFQRYETTTGRLELVGRTGGYGVKIAGAAGDRILWFGDPADSTAEAKLEQRSDGDFGITPRSTFKVKVFSALEVTGPLVMASYTVGTLPSAATYVRGRAYVTDANATTFNSVVAAGGANKVPVFSDGTSWRIG